MLLKSRINSQVSNEKIHAWTIINKIMQPLYAVIAFTILSLFLITTLVNAQTESNTVNRQDTRLNKNELIRLPKAAGSKASKTNTALSNKPSATVANTQPTVDPEPTSPTKATRVNSIRVWDAPDHTRLVFDLSAPAQFNTFALRDPKRFVIDLQNAENVGKLPDLSNNPRIKSIRHGTLEKTVYRYVLEVPRSFEVNAFQLSPNKLYGNRLVVDLFDLKTNTADAVQNAQPSSPQASTESNPATPVNAASTNAVPQQKQAVAQETQQQEIAPATKAAQSNNNNNSASNASASIARLKNKKLVVAIDAGHGGEDPGAIGHRRLREKHIVLAIAKKLQTIINKTPNMQAHLVRKGDYFIRLRDRTKAARKYKADLFVSIHADAFTKKTASGFSVFALSQRGASSEMARTLARKENAADLIGGVSLKNKDDLLAQVLFDLSMTKNINEGVEFGNSVLRELSKLGKLHSRRVEQAGFAVLKSPDIPSILIETGFITNPTEAKRLNTKSYQKSIANAIFTGIQKYHRNNPTFEQHTNLVAGAATNNSTQRRTATQSTAGQARVHTVRRGEFLSGIAKRYGVSLKNLRQWNKLKSSKIVIGQKLNIADPTISISSQAIAPQNTNSSATLTYKVRRGDNLSTVAQRHGVSMRQIRQDNRLKNSRLLVGQKLLIRNKISRSGQSNSPAKQVEYAVHIVKSGQTLSGVADKYRLKMATIKRDNQLKSSRLRIGQKLKIRQTQTNTRSRAKKQSYTVKRGDNLSLIAKKHGTTVKALKQQNKLKSNKLFVGQVLRL